VDRSRTRFRGSAGCAVVVGLGLLLFGASVSQRFAGGLLFGYGALVFVLLLLLPRIKLARDKELGRWHALDARASRLHRRDQLAAAQPLYEQALEAAEGSGRPELIADAADHLADLCADQGRLNEAELLYRHALAIRESGSDFRATAITLDSLAEVQLRARHHTQAVETSERWLRLLRDNVGAHLGRSRDRAYAGWLDRHAERLEKAGRPGDADALRSQAAALRAGVVTENDRRPP
jgi:tetratricopeptide (TPR) repeat protein